MPQSLQKLRGYQEKTIGEIKDKLMEGYRRIVVSMPTGSGKSVVMEYLIRGAQAKQNGVLFVVNRIQLVKQMSRRLEDAEILHGYIQGQNTKDPLKSILVASISTIIRRGFPEGIKLVLIDECHACAGTRSYQKLIEHYASQCVTIIGFTATSFVDGLGRNLPYGKLFEVSIHPVSIRELIDMKYLVDVDIYAPSDPDLEKISVKCGDSVESELSKLMDVPKLVGDTVQHWVKYAYGKPTILFAVDICHSKHFAEEFARIGVKSKHVDCYQGAEVVEQALQELRDGTITVLCNPALLSEGVDVPCAEVLLLNRPTKSLRLFIQIVGRILRPFPGKERALILDHSGASLRLGIPTDPLPLGLRDGTLKKQRGPVGKKDKILEPTTCPNCKELKPLRTPKCPFCGFVTGHPNKVNVVDSELVPRKGKVKATDRLKELTKQDLYSQLLGAMGKGAITRKGVMAIFKKMTNSWPDGLREMIKEPTIDVLNYIRHSLIKFHMGRLKHGIK